MFASRMSSFPSESCSAPAKRTKLLSMPSAVPYPRRIRDGDKDYPNVDRWLPLTDSGLWGRHKLQMRALISPCLLTHGRASLTRTCAWPTPVPNRT